MRTRFFAFCCAVLLIGSTGCASQKATTAEEPSAVETTPTPAAPSPTPTLEMPNTLSEADLQGEWSYYMEDEAGNQITGLFWINEDGTQLLTAYEPGFDKAPIEDGMIEITGNEVVWTGNIGGTTFKMAGVYENAILEGTMEVTGVGNFDIEAKKK